MPVRYVGKPPQDVLDYDHEQLSAENIAEVAEIFQTPLAGAYVWDYDTADEKIRRLYRLGKLLNWNAEIDLDWNRTYPKTERPIIDGINPFEEYPFYSRMTDAEKLRFGWHSQAWTLSQFLHGEQGALLVASQLVSCAPTLERLIPTQVYKEFGWDVEESRTLFLGASFMELFSQTLFNRIIPNLKKIGLLTESVRPLYEKLGVLHFENEIHDGDIDWAVLETPVKVSA